MSDGITVNLNPDDINQMVSRAILQSAIGKELTSRIEAAVSAVSLDWNNPIDAVIREELRHIVVAQLTTDPAVAKRVSNAVQARLTDAAISELVEQILSR